MTALQRRVYRLDIKTVLIVVVLSFWLITLVMLSQWLDKQQPGAQYLAAVNQAFP